jgi:nucleoid-associated protein YgaU
MNREIKITLVVLVLLVGVIVYLEMNQKDDVLPEVEPIQELEILEEKPSYVPVPNPEPKEPEGGEGGLGGSPRLEQSLNDVPEPDVFEEVVVRDDLVIEGKPEVSDSQVGLTSPEKAEVLAVNAQIPSEYRVQKGDTLSQIAEKVLGSVQFVPALLEANPELQPHQLFVGVELEMPSRGKLEDLVAKKTSLKAEIDGPGFYRIGKGDSIYKISKSLYGTTKRVSEILKLNPNIDPRQLKIGQIIRLPSED